MSPEKAPVVILSSIEWSAAWQRHQSFARQWARAGHAVFFVENTGFREPRLRDLKRLLDRLRPRPGADAPEGVRLISPFVLPPTRRLFREANESLLIPRLVDALYDRGLRGKPVVFAYLPTATTLALLDQLDCGLVVYDCVDNFRGLPQAPADLAATEAELIARAGLVLTTSRTLYEDKKSLHPRVVELHHGAGPAFFLPPKPPAARRRLCYFGTLWRAVDYAPIKALAEAGFDVELIGPAKQPPPELPASVILRGPVPHEELPGLLSSFDALLLPYVDDEYNRGVIPAKTYECLATGRPVLASPLPALSGLSGLLTICRAPRDWVEAARSLDALDEPSLRQKRVETARAHAEEAVFARLRAHVDEARAHSAAPLKRPARAGILSGLGWIGLLYTTAKASTLLTQFLAGRLLGPAEYGRANLAVAAAAYLQIFPMLGFPLATSKLISEEQDEERRRRLVSTALASFLAWTVLCLPLMAAAHRLLENALGLPPSLFILSVLLAAATALSQVLASPLLGLKRFAQRGLVETVYGLGAPLVLLGLVAWLGPTHRAMLSALAASLLASSAYALWSLRRYLKPAFEPRLVRAVGRYAATASLTLLATACVLAPARLFLNRHAGAQEVGLFSAYFTATVQVALALLYMLQAVLIPTASAEQGQRQSWDFLKRWAAPALPAAWAIFLACAVAGFAAFGKRYPLDLSWAALFAAAAALILAHGVVSALYAARDYSGLRVSVAGALLSGLGNAALTALLVPRYGVPGAALGLILSFCAGLAFYGLVAFLGKHGSRLS